MVMAGGLAMRTFAGLVALAIVLICPGVARADLFLVFNQGHARVGQRVEAVSGDQRGPQPLPPVHSIRLYFVPMAHAKSPSHQTSTGPPTDPTWVPLGRLRHPHAGVFRFSFIVPRVAPGDYTVGFWCIPCAPPKGAAFTGAYPGHISTGRPFTKILRVTPSNRTERPARGRPVRKRDGSSGQANAISAAAGLAVCLSALAVVRLFTR